MTRDEFSLLISELDWVGSPSFVRRGEGSSVEILRGFWQRIEEDKPTNFSPICTYTSFAVPNPLCVQRWDSVCAVRRDFRPRRFTCSVYSVHVHSSSRKCRPVICNVLTAYVLNFFGMKVWPLTFWLGWTITEFTGRCPIGPLWVLTLMELLQVRLRKIN